MKAILVMILCIVVLSCENTTQTPCRASFEFFGGNVKDTFNRIDCRGLKQGKWIPTKENKMKDTAYYKNDTVIVL